MVWVGGSNGQWSFCAAKCQEDASCQGWTYVYDGSPGASSFQCWLKFNLWSTDYTQWKSNDNDISGLRKAETLQRSATPAIGCVGYGLKCDRHQDDCCFGTVCDGTIFRGWYCQR